MHIKKSIKYIIRGILYICSPAVIYFLLSILLSLIPINKQESSNDGIEIYLLSNGVHLDIVLPINTEYKNWISEIWIDSLIIDRAQYISFGWGDKDFYLNTPEWSDLTLKTAIKAMFFKSQSAMHIDYYASLNTNKQCRKLLINSNQYLKIVKYIDDSFMRDSNNFLQLVPEFQYNNFDCFYDATRSYSLFFTCNTWTNKCLKQAGLKSCLWTPFDKGILYHYK